MASSSSLRDLLVEEKEGKKRMRCTMCILLRDLDGDDRVALFEALSDNGVSSNIIAKALTRIGIKISPSAISRHRRECGSVH